MPLPLAVAICENDLRRDLTFLKAFAGHRCDLRVTPLGVGTLGPKATRLVAGQVKSFLDAGMAVSAIIVHHDQDRMSLKAARTKISTWFAAGQIAKLGCKLVCCVPAPCLERWLCCVEQPPRKARSANPAAGCQPWKDAWEQGGKLDLDRVRDAAEAARERLAGLVDFDAFHRDWLDAGLP